MYCIITVYIKDYIYVDIYIFSDIFIPLGFHFNYYIKRKTSVYVINIFLYRYTSNAAILSHENHKFAFIILIINLALNTRDININIPSCDFYI